MTKALRARRLVCGGRFQKMQSNPARYPTCEPETSRNCSHRRAICCSPYIILTIAIACGQKVVMKDEAVMAELHADRVDRVAKLDEFINGSGRIAQMFNEKTGRSTILSANR